MRCSYHSFITWEGWEPHLLHFLCSPKILGPSSIKADLFESGYQKKCFFQQANSQHCIDWDMLIAKKSYIRVAQSSLRGSDELTINSLVMRFVIERGSSPPSNWNYLSKYFELFSGHSCHFVVHGNNYRLIKMIDMSKIVLILLGLKGGVTQLIADYRYLITHKLLCYQCYYI